MLCSQLCQLLLYLSVAGRFADGCLHLVQQIALVEFVHTYLDVAHAGDVISVGDCVEDGGPSSVFGQKGRVDHNQAVREEVDELFGQHVAIGAYNPEIGLGHGTGQTAPLLLPLLPVMSAIDGRRPRQIVGPAISLDFIRSLLLLWRTGRYNCETRIVLSEQLQRRQSHATRPEKHKIGVL